jgi:hypothetical protein
VATATRIITDKEMDMTDKCRHCSRCAFWREIQNPPVKISDCVTVCINISRGLCIFNVMKIASSKDVSLLSTISEARHASIYKNHDSTCINFLDVVDVWDIEEHIEVDG